MRRIAGALIVALGLAGSAAAQGPVSDAALDGADALAFNAWCFNVLFNHGVRHGYAEPYHERMAGYAMADARARMAALAREAEMTDSAFGTLDRGFFVSTEPEAARLADGTAPDDLVARYDGCRSRGLRGLHAERRHAAFLAEREEQLWCQLTMEHFTARQMIGGGAERAQRGATAARGLSEIVGHAFLWAGIGGDDRDDLVGGAYFRTLVQVEAFGIGGGKERFERDYEPCFAMADLPLPLPSFDFPPPAEIRPPRTPAAWDYPLSFEFRHAIWCRELVRRIDSDPLIARIYALSETGKVEVADHADRLLAAEAAAVGMSAAHFEAAARDTSRQVIYEFQRFDETGSYDALAYDFGSCSFLGAEAQLDSVFDALFGPVDDAARLDEAMWCLAGFELVLERPTEHAQTLRTGIDFFASEAMAVAPGLDLDEEAMLQKLGQYQTLVRTEIGDRRAPDGSGLMIDYCVTLLPP